MTTATISRTAAAANTVAPRDAFRMVQSGAGRIVDIREVDEHRRDHVAGASLFPVSVFSVTGFPAAQAGQATLVLCRSGNRASAAAEALRSAGRTDISVIEGGIVGWEKAGLPVIHDAKAPIPLFRQVMVVAGLLLVACTALAAWVSPWFLTGTGFIGMGLAVAGLTGFCPMALVLAKMPWNRASTALSAANKCGTACAADDDAW